MRTCVCCTIQGRPMEVSCLYNAARMDFMQDVEVDDFSGLLSTLLDDVVPTASLQALPVSEWPSYSHFARSTLTQEAPPQRQPSTAARTNGSGGGGQEETSRKPGTRRPRSSNKGMSEQVQQLEQTLSQQLLELQQLLRRNIYLQERMHILEQLIKVKEQQTARYKAIKSGNLPFDPARRLGVSVQEFKKATPQWLAGTFSQFSKRLAMLLASIMPLLTKYPQLISTRPPAGLMQSPQPTPEVDSLTLAPPHEPSIEAIAAAYGLNMAALTASDRTQLASFAQVLLEHHQVVVSTKFVNLMAPNLMLAGAFHISAIDACNTSWDNLASSLNGLRIWDGDGGAPQTAHANDPGGLTEGAATIADMAHWRNVAAQMRLSNEQRLKAAVLWEIIDGAIKGIHANRSQLARQMMQLLQPPTTSSQSSAPTGLEATGSEWGVQSVPEPSKLALDASREKQDASSAVWRSQQQLTQQEMLLQRLNNTLIQERFLAILVGEMITSAVLSPCQGLMLMIETLPYMPHQLSLLQACASEFTPQIMDELVAAAQATHMPATSTT